MKTAGGTRLPASKHRGPITCNRGQSYLDMIEKRAWRSEGIEANNLKAFLVLGSRLTICLESAVKAGDCSSYKAAAYLAWLRWLALGPFVNLTGGFERTTHEME